MGQFNNANGLLEAESAHEDLPPSQEEKMDQKINTVPVEGLWG